MTLAELRDLVNEAITDLGPETLVIVNNTKAEFEIKWLSNITVSRIESEAKHNNFFLIKV